MQVVRKIHLKHSIRILVISLMNRQTVRLWIIANFAEQDKQSQVTVVLHLLGWFGTKWFEKICSCLITYH